MVNDIDAAEEWLNNWTASVNAQAERAAQLTSRVAALTAKAESGDGSIKVTVGSTGQIEKLTDPRPLTDAEAARSWPGRSSR